MLGTLRALKLIGEDGKDGTGKGSGWIITLRVSKSIQKEDEKPWS